MLDDKVEILGWDWPQNLKFCHYFGIFGGLYFSTDAPRHARLHEHEELLKIQYGQTFLPDFFYWGVRHLLRNPAPEQFLFTANQERVLWFGWLLGTIVVSYSSPHAERQAWIVCIICKEKNSRSPFPRPCRLLFYFIFTSLVVDMFAAFLKIILFLNW
jgi:hypothetical protein